MTEPVVLRASSLSDFFDCPARAEARHLLGLRCPSSPAATIGTAIHASTAVFDNSTITGAGITADEAAGAAVDAIHQPNDDIAWDDDVTPSVAEKIAVALHGKYCTEIAPKQDYLAVEVTCERLDITDIGLSLTGTTDRIRRTEYGNGIADLKSGKTAVSADGTVKTQGHAFQIGVYELLAEHASGIRITEPAQIIGLTTGKTEKGQRVGTGEISNAKDVLVGDENHPGILQMVAETVHKGIFFGNPRSMLCGEKYCPIFNKCNYRK